MERKLYRSRKHRIFLGVCGGLGEYYRVDPVIVRVFAVLITVVTSFFPGIIAYFILAMIVPVEGSQAGSSEETFKENLADLEHSSRNIGEQIRKTAGSAGPTPPPTPPPPAQNNRVFPPYTRSNRGLYILAIILVALGVLFIIIKQYGWLWSYLWPLALIIAGGIIITLVLTRKKST